MKHQALPISAYRAYYKRCSSKMVKGMRESITARINAIESRMLEIHSSLPEWIALATERSNLIASLPDYDSVSPAGLSRFHEEHRFAINLKSK